MGFQIPQTTETGMEPKARSAVFLSNLLKFLVWNQGCEDDWKLQLLCVCEVPLLVAERSPGGSRCLWNPPHHHWQTGCGGCSPSEDTHKCLNKQPKTWTEQTGVEPVLRQGPHQVYGVPLVCVRQLPWNKSLPFLSVCSGEFWGTQDFVLTVMMRIKSWVCVCRHEGLPETARWICVPLGPLSQLWTIELAILVRWPM